MKVGLILRNVGRLMLSGRSAGTRMVMMAALLSAIGSGGCVTSSDGFVKTDAPSPSANAAATYATGSADVGGSDDLANAAAKYATPATPGPSAYRVGPQDVLDISVFNVAQLTRISQVADDGSINFPLIGELQVGGKTTRQIEADMAGRLGARYLQSPQVSVIVKEYNSQRVTVEGEVRKPGVYPIKGGTTLLQSIAQAEGVNNDTASSTALVFRNTGSGRSVARFDLDEVRAGRAADPWVQQGDTIVVEASQGKATFNNFTKMLPALGFFRPI
jgi:polysaccharide export outer membrane protein